MRVVAWVLIAGGLATVSTCTCISHNVPLAAAGLVLAGAWSLAIGLRWPRSVHITCLGCTSCLLAIHVFAQTPTLLALFALTAALYGWDLVMMDLATAAYAREITLGIARRYAGRCLLLAGLGLGVACAVSAVRVHMPFAAALALSCLCLVLLAVIRREARRQFAAVSAGKEEADG
jgi:membrane-bound ClpP family serine protease